MHLNEYYARIYTKELLDPLWNKYEHTSPVNISNRINNIRTYMFIRAQHKPIIWFKFIMIETREIHNLEETNDLNDVQK